MDEEVLSALSEKVGRAQLTPDILAAKQAAIAASVGRGNAPDDVKSASGEIYTQLSRILSLSKGGNTFEAFCLETLAPVTVGTAVYEHEQLRADIFGN